MKTRTTEAKAVELLKSRIDAIDLEPIKFKLVKEYDWTVERADKVEPLYKAFLLLQSQFEKIVPTHAIDEMWHAHILDTRKYFEDCDAVFGEYVHHFPYFGIRNEQDAEELKKSFETSKEHFATLGIDVVALSSHALSPNGSVPQENFETAAMCQPDGSCTGCASCTTKEDILAFSKSVTHRPNRNDLMALQH